MSEMNKIKYQKRFERNGCTEDQLKRLVELKALTPEEFKEITGKDYTK